MNCALAACIVFPGGRNELRPYIHYDISYNNRTHTQADSFA